MIDAHVRCEPLADPGALDTLAPAMDEPHLAKARIHCCVEIGVDHAQDLGRVKVVKIDRFGDLHDDGLVGAGRVFTHGSAG